MTITYTVKRTSWATPGGPGYRVAAQHPPIAGSFLYAEQGPSEWAGETYPTKREAEAAAAQYREAGEHPCLVAYLYD